VTHQEADWLAGSRHRLAVRTGRQCPGIRRRVERHADDLLAVRQDQSDFAAPIREARLFRLHPREDVGATRHGRLV